MIGEFLQWQQKSLSPWKPSERILVVLRRNRLTCLREYCGGPNYSRTRRKRLRQSFIGIVASLVDQQQIDRNDFWLQPGDRVHYPFKIDPGERIGALLLYDHVVDRNNGHEIRRQPYAANNRS